MPADNYATLAIAAVDAEMPSPLPDDLLALYALLALTRGTETTLQDVHDAWSVWRQATDPAHRSLIPFDQLTHEVQELDRPYMEAIHRAAKELTDADPLLDPERVGRALRYVIADLDYDLHKEIERNEDGYVEQFMKAYKEDTPDAH